MDLLHRIATARGRLPADLVLKNTRLINVYSGEIETTDIAIADGVVVGLGDYEGKAEVDLDGAYAAPGFIDGHVHIESSMTTPASFARIVLPKGTTTVIADPHEIANVSGVKGIEFMLENAKASPLGVHVMIPSCVPTNAHENAGASITVEDVETLSSKPGVLGLGEVMDYPAVLSADPDIHGKISVMAGRPIDGHAPDILGKDLNAYAVSGIMTDHECTRPESLRARVSRGMYVHLRQGSATRNVKDLLEGVTQKNMRRLMFCTDDKHPEDIDKEGHINYNVNLAIAAGVDAVEAIRMASLNIAECYGLNHIGAIAPGKDADIIVFDDLNDIAPTRVYKKGILVAEDGHALFKHENIHDEALTDSIKVKEDAIDFTLPLKHGRVHVIGLVKNNITTKKSIRDVRVLDGVYTHDPGLDILKLAVIERHRASGNIGIGLVEGFGIENGAIAMSIAHDSHNLIVIGDDDEAMKTATDALIACKGGIIIVQDGVVVAKLPLEIAGLMTREDPEEVAKKLADMRQIVRSMGLHEDIDDPFITLAFLALPVIPLIKLTDRGLFDVENNRFIDIEAA